MTAATAQADLESIRESGGHLQTDGAVLSQVVSFRLGKEQYATNIMCVQEIILKEAITSIPEVPDYICGLINLRGKVIPIVDLRKRLRLEAEKETEHTRIIVVNSKNHTFGIVVDAVNEVLRLENDQIEPPPKGLQSLDSTYIDGLVKMEDTIMILLSIEGILTEDEQSTIADAASKVS